MCLSREINLKNQEREKNHRMQLCEEQQRYKEDINRLPKRRAILEYRPKEGGEKNMKRSIEQASAIKMCSNAITGTID